jgi:hypothetical protein
MNAFIKLAFGIALSLAVTGHLKSATLKMAEMAAEAQKHQLKFNSFSRMLTEPDTKPRHRKNDLQGY